ncbi:hypothetical protein ES703_49967 [subsurface metagenome]
MSELLTPLSTQLGMGGIGGFAVGYSLKKLAKLTAIIIGFAFVGLQYLAYKGIIAINYAALKSWASSLMGQAGDAQGLIVDIFANVPYAAAFTGGFLLGLKKG